MFLVALAFLAPALVLLGALVVYPIVFTLVRSFQDNAGNFVWGGNYVDMFTNEATFTAIRNNVSSSTGAISGGWATPAEGRSAVLSAFYSF